MSFLKLTYCHLIRIILSQIGGNPLQQIYTHLTNGVPTVAPRSGPIPAGLAQVKDLVEQVTETINTAQQAVGDFTDTVERIGAQFYQNPIGTVLTGTVTVAQTRLNTVNSKLSLLGNQNNPDLLQEKQALTQLISSLQTYKTNTDRLSGVGTLSGSAAAGGCSLQDLMGSGCVPNKGVPDIDLQNLISSLKQGDAIAAIREKISSATGYSDYQQSLVTFQTTVNQFISTFNNSINKAAVRSAVSAQMTNIVFNLLSGCGNEILDLTLRPDVRNAIFKYTTTLQEAQDGGFYYDSLGNKIDVLDTEINPNVGNVKISL